MVKIRVLAIMSSLPAILILAGFAIDLAAGRWGAYIRSPVPGLYLADFLLGFGSLIALVWYRRLFDLRPEVSIVFAVVVVYLGVRGFHSLIWDPVSDRYLAIRDLAPFGYLALVPIIAVALRQVTWGFFVWVVRITATTHLVGYTLTSWGLITPFASPLLGAEFVSFFEYRGDLLGVVFGIGFLAWGRWPDIATASRTAQFAFIALQFDQSGRASFLTFLFCIVLDILRERSWWPPRRSLVLLFGSILASWIISAVEDNWSEITKRLSLPDAVTVHGPSREVLEAPAIEAPAIEAPAIEAPAPITFDLVPDAIRRQADLGLSRGTSNARILTWTQVVQALPYGGLWVFGGGLGSNILYRICSQGPYHESIYPGGGIKRPKCDVDSNEAPTILRDPHNWLLNSILYHGVIGTTIFLAAILVPVWTQRRSRHSSFAIISIGAYFVCGTFGVILSASFGMLPVAVFLAWLLRDSLELRNPRVSLRTSGDRWDT